MLLLLKFRLLKAIANIQVFLHSQTLKVKKNKNILNISVLFLKRVFIDKNQ